MTETSKFMDVLQEVRDQFVRLNAMVIERDQRIKELETALREIKSLSEKEK